MWFSWDRRQTESTPAIGQPSTAKRGDRENNPHHRHNRHSSDGVLVVTVVNTHYLLGEAVQDADKPAAPDEVNRLPMLLAANPEGNVAAVRSVANSASGHGPPTWLEHYRTVWTRMSMSVGFRV